MTGISACMIVRDEAGRLAACIESIRPWVDEICILDTGSSDETLAIARRYGARIATFDWDEDFAAARNASLDLATHSWILVIDADERLCPESAASLRTAAAATNRTAWLVECESGERGGLDRIALPRLFRNGLGIRFERRVHESIQPSLRALGIERLERCGVRLVHDRDLPDSERARGKCARNVRLLRRAIAEDPDDLFALYELALGLVDPGERSERLMLLRRAELLARRASPSDRQTHPFLPLVFESLAGTLGGLGRFSEALDVVDDGLHRFPNVIELRWRRGSLLRRVGRASDAEHELRRCLDSSSGTGRGGAATDGGVDLRALAWLEIAHLARLDGDSARALHAVRRARRKRPDDVAAQRLEIDLLLDEDEFGETGLRALHAFLGERPHASESWMLGARVAWVRGDRETAFALWENAIDAGDDAAVEARLRLAVAQLADGDRSAAERNVDALRPTDVSTAAGKILLAVVAGRPPDVDPAFDPRTLATALESWLQPLLDAVDDTAARSFQENASSISDVLPGITLYVPAS